MTLGKLSVKYRSERSYYGVEPAVLKSGLQKYLRRNEREKGLWCLIELDLFRLGLSHIRELAQREGITESAVITRIKSIRTNLINRLVVMISEEINIHQWWLPSVMWGLYQTWCATRDEDSSRTSLVKMYLQLLSAEKCRLISDYKTIYNLPPYYLSDQKRLIALHKRFLEKRDPALYEINYGQDTDKLTPQELVTKALELAAQGKEEALFFCGRLLDRAGSKKHIESLWERLLQEEVATKAIQALRGFYHEMTHKEQPIYLYHALLLVIFRDRINLRERPIEVEISGEEVASLYQKHLTEERILLDNFVFDRHTGKRMKEGRVAFALEGAHVENESKAFLSERYRALYIDFKKVLDGSHPEAL